MVISARLAVVVLALALAGCGTTVAQPMTLPPAPTPKATAAARSPRAVAVKIRDFEFGPRTLRITRGTRVTWSDADTTNHTVTFAKGRPGDLGNLDPGDMVSAHFTRAGIYAYVCTYHPNMRGRVVVD